MILARAAAQLLLLAVLSRGTAASAATSGTTAAAAAAAADPPPYVVPTEWLPADVDLSQFPEADWTTVTACCRPQAAAAVTDESCPAPSVEDNAASAASAAAAVPLLLERVPIGRVPRFSTPQALAVLQDSVAAWNHGAGAWPQMTVAQRAARLRAYLAELATRREEIVRVLMWEIGKNRPDAEAEFDRTLAFAESVMEVVLKDKEFTGEWQTIGTTRAFVKRAAIGVYLTLAPYNYPLNESYACLIPLLLMGNVCILKVPTVGGLVHLLTMEALRKSLPPGTVNFIAGSGRATMPPLMATGQVDGLAFIGGSKAADELIKAHPEPHRLKIFLQLEANNMAIYLPDLFQNQAALDNALDEAVLGSLSYNGQRCTALKLHYVPAPHIDKYLEQLVQRVDALPVGLPEQRHGADGSRHSAVTPLPNLGRIDYMRELLADATAKGARIVNPRGGEVLGGPESTLMVPAVLYPVTPDMKVFHEEQFGPIVPVTTYTDLKEVLEFGQRGQPYGQQVSIFGQDADAASDLLDGLSLVYCKINLNQQCGRSPDTLPFAGRRSSAMGVMSVKDALREFSVPTVVAYKDKKGLNEKLVEGLQRKSNFLQAAQ